MSTKSLGFQLFRFGLSTLTLFQSIPLIGADQFWDAIDKYRDQSSRVELLNKDRSVLEAEFKSIPEKHPPTIEAYRVQRWEEAGRSGVTGLRIQQSFSRMSDYQKTVLQNEMDSLPIRGEKEGLSREKHILALLYHKERLQVEIAHISDRRERLQSIQNFLKGDQRLAPSILLEKEIIQSLMRSLEMEFVRLESEAQSVDRELLVRNWSMTAHLHWPIEKDDMEAMQSFKKTRFSLEERRQILFQDGLQKQMQKLPEYKEVSVYAAYDFQDGLGREKNVSLGVSMPLPVSGQHQKEMNVLAQRKSAVDAALNVERNDNEVKAAELKTRAEGLQKQGLSLRASASQKLEGIVDQANRQLRSGLIGIMQYLEIDRSVHTELEMHLDWKESLVGWWLDSCQSQPCEYRSRLGAK